MNHAGLASHPLTIATAQVQGFHSALQIGACFALAATILGFFLIKEKRCEKIEIDPAAMAA